MNFAPYSRRFLAYFIDWAISFGVTVVLIIIGTSLVASDSSTALGVIFIILGALTPITFGFWNRVIREGKTGQSIGRSRTGISLVDATTQSPLGPGRAFLRALVAFALSLVSGGLYWIVDYLFPLWDPKKQRLTDKIISSVVVSN